jgi:class 3 adenylate cyclase
MAAGARFEVDDTARGALALQPRLTGEPYTAADRALLQTIVSSAAVHLRNLRLLATVQATGAELARKVQALAVVNEIALGMASRPAARRLYRFVLERVAAALGAGEAAFLVPERGGWALAARRPEPTPDQPTVVEADALDLEACAGAAWSVAAGGVAGVDGADREVVAPIRYGAHLCGALWLRRAAQERPFDDGDRDLLALLGREIAVVLENNRLFETSLAQQQEHFRLRGVLEQYLAPSVAERLIGGGLDLSRSLTHRTMSLVRVDMRASTEFVHALDVDVLVQLMNEYIGAMTDVLFRYEGTIDRFDGDAVIAFFGAPEAHADDPVRAVRTGLEMQRAFAALLAQWRERYSLPARLGIGVGIATGEVVVGNVGSAKRLHYTVSGLTANLAARLMAKAPAGALLLDETTWHVVQAPLDLPARVRARQPRYIRAKGFRDLVPVYRLRPADVPVG